MTKRHPMVCHDSSSWSFGVKKEIFSSLGQKERLILKGNYGDPHRSDLTLLFTCLRENHLQGRLCAGESVLAYFGVMYYNV